MKISIHIVIEETLTPGTRYLVPVLIITHHLQLFYIYIINMHYIELSYNKILQEIAEYIDNNKIKYHP